MKSYTDLEQSKILARILPLESADMYWDYDVQKHEDYPMVMDDQFDDTCIRAWSLASLLESITKVQQGGVFYNLTYDFILSKWTMNIEADNWRGDLVLYDNPVDACVDFLVKLHELNIL